MGSLLDVPGLRLGHWTGQGTGCTVVLAPDDGAVAAIDVRGGAPATFDTELLKPGNLVQRVNALVLTGGSVFGLAALIFKSSSKLRITTFEKSAIAFSR